MAKKAIIIGAGPAGLTAAYELLNNSDIQVTILEAENFLGGISSTHEYKGNLMDIGGHRLFSKSDKIVKWWLNFLPLAEEKTNNQDKVMLRCNRKSRIYYDHKFFNYPVTLDLDTLKKLGIKNIF